MINEIITIALKLVILVVFALISTYVIPWIKANLTEKQISNIKFWANEFVICAEKLFPSTDEEKTGEIKLATVTTWLNKLVANTDVTLTDAQVRGIIEDCVDTLNKTQEGK